MGIIMGITIMVIINVIITGTIRKRITAASYWHVYH